jgi:hypothetical protein
MQYRSFGRTGVQVSALGFGCMRLPMKGNRVDRRAALPMLQRAYELGVNYFDTGKLYCEQDSERTLGEAVRGMDRSKVYLATKYSQDAPTARDLRAKFETSLKIMKLDYIDFYHFWGISWEQFTTRLAIKGGPLEAFLKLKEEGLARRLSFSFHSAAEEMNRLVDTGYFETVLCQYNLLDRANEKAIAYAAGKGLGVAIMGPVGGGRLVEPASLLRRLLPGKRRVTTPELALRFVLSNPGVSVALSGMSSTEQVEENVATASRTTQLTADERERLARALDETRTLADLYCTGCKYCMPCPNDVDIPRIFELVNYRRVYGLVDYARQAYRELLEGRSWPKGARAADACTQCGQCVEKCPQKIKIIEQLREAHRVLQE